MTQPFSRRIANWPWSMISFIIPISIARPSVWRSRRQLSNQRFACVPMQVKHILRAQHIFIAATVIMVALWLSWKLLDRLCPMTPGYSSSNVTSSDDALVAIKRRRYAIWSAQLISTRAMLSSFYRLRLATTIFAAMPTKKPSWTARWRSSQTASRRKPRGRRWNLIGKPIPAPGTD